MIGLLLTSLLAVLWIVTLISNTMLLLPAQTGNIVLGIIQSFDGEWLCRQKVLSTLFSLWVFYLLQIPGSTISRKKEKHFWRLFVLYYEAVIFFLVSLPSINAHPAPCNNHDCFSPLQSNGLPLTKSMDVPTRIYSQQET